MKIGTKVKVKIPVDAQEWTREQILCIGRIGVVDSTTVDDVDGEPVILHQVKMIGLHWEPLSFFASELEVL